MFGMVGEDPPLLMISVNRLEDGAQKDTAANLDATGEFVVHIPDDADGRADARVRPGPTRPTSTSSRPSA